MYSTRQDRLTHTPERIVQGKLSQLSLEKERPCSTLRGNQVYMAEMNILEGTHWFWHLLLVLPLRNTLLGIQACMKIESIVLGKATQ